MHWPVQYCRAIITGYHIFQLDNLKTLKYWTDFIATRIGSYSLFCLAAYLACEEKAVSSGTCFVAGMILLAFSQLEKFESFKGLGFEATLTKLNEKITEADELLTRLQRLSLLISESIIDTNSKIGRLSGALSNKEQYRYVQNIRSILDDHTKEEINKVLAPWIWITTLDIVIKFINTPIAELISQRTKLLDIEANKTNSTQPLNQGQFDYINERRRELEVWNNWLHEVIQNRNNHKMISLEIILDKCKWMTSAEAEGITKKVSPWLSEIEYLSENYDLKPPKLWLEESIR